MTISIKRPANKSPLGNRKMSSSTLKLKLFKDGFFWALNQNTQVWFDGICFSIGVIIGGSLGKNAMYFLLLFYEKNYFRFSRGLKKIDTCTHRFDVYQWIIITDGQMLANRLSKQINRVSKIIKKRIEDYNKNSYTGQSNGSTSLPDKIEFDTK